MEPAKQEGTVPVASSPLRLFSQHMDGSFSVKPLKQKQIVSLTKQPRKPWVAAQGPGHWAAQARLLPCRTLEVSSRPWAVSVQAGVQARLAPACLWRPWVLPSVSHGAWVIAAICLLREGRERYSLS